MFTYTTRRMSIGGNHTPLQLEALRLQPTVQREPRQRMAVQTDSNHASNCSKLPLESTSNQDTIDFPITTVSRFGVVGCFQRKTPLKSEQVAPGPTKARPQGRLSAANFDAPRRSASLVKEQSGLQASSQSRPQNSKSLHQGVQTLEKAIHETAPMFFLLAAKV